MIWDRSLWADLEIPAGSSGASATLSSSRGGFRVRAIIFSVPPATTYASFHWLMEHARVSVDVEGEELFSSELRDIPGSLGVCSQVPTPMEVQEFTIPERVTVTLDFGDAEIKRGQDVAIGLLGEGAEVTGDKP